MNWKERLKKIRDLINKTADEELRKELEAEVIAIEAQAGDDRTPPAPVPTPTPTPAPAPGAPAPNNQVAALEEQVRQLNKLFTEEKEARETSRKALEAQQAEQAKKAREEKVEAAIKAGLFAVGEKDTYLQRLEKDPEGWNAWIDAGIGSKTPDGAKGTPSKGGEKGGETKYDSQWARSKNPVVMESIEKSLPKE